MYKLFISVFNAKDKYMGDNLNAGNLHSNLSRMKKINERLKNHRAVQRRWRMALGQMRNPGAFLNAK